MILWVSVPTLHWGSRAGVRGSAISLVKVELVGESMVLSLLQGEQEVTAMLTVELCEANYGSEAFGQCLCCFSELQTQLIRKDKMMQFLDLKIARQHERLAA